MKLLLHNADRVADRVAELEAQAAEQAEQIRDLKAEVARECHRADRNWERFANVARRQTTSEPR